MDRRAAREDAVSRLRSAGETVGLDPIPKRASPEDVSTFYKTLCKKASYDMAAEILEARAQWLDNGGGGDLPEELVQKLQGRGPAPADTQADLDSFISSHKKVVQSFYNDVQKKFRLQSKAFLWGSQIDWD